MQQWSQNTELETTLTVLELPNLFALLDRMQRARDAEATIALTTWLYRLLEFAGKSRLLERVGQVRDAAAKELDGAWNHAQFEAERTRLEQQLANGRLREAYEGAPALLQRARAAGEQAYPIADYDLAMACLLLARVLRMAGDAEPALPLLIESRQRFETIAKERPGRGAEGMVVRCFEERGRCLHDLGRFDEAAAVYEECIRRSEQGGDDRQVAVCTHHLGTVRLHQRRYPEALAAYTEARERFTLLAEPGMVAASWHHTGMAYHYAGQPEAAEDAYRQALVIEVQFGDVIMQADTLGQLGDLYDDVLDRPEEAAAFYRQAAGKYVEIGDTAREGHARSNLSHALLKLRRLIEARQESLRAIECKAPFGHAASPWASWGTLADIETDAGNPAAAAEARAKALAGYLAYRRDGGENHSDSGRLTLAVTQSLLAGDLAAAVSLLQQQAP